MEYVENIIIGAGIAGIAAGEKLTKENKEYIILEKDSTYGGLCGNFQVEDFRFDRFVHLSFTKDQIVRKYFDSIPYITHIPDPVNYYHGLWIKHPAQNNLFPLADNEKEKILKDMYKRKETKTNQQIDNYEEWLRIQFGDYFAEKFPMSYTRKYWGVDAKTLGTEWIENRIYQPTIEEVIQGMKNENMPSTYYAKEMRYPKKGGFKSFLSSFVDEHKIRYNEEVLNIDLIKKIVKTNKNIYQYEKLISSIPLPEYKHIIMQDIGINEYLEKLVWTSAYLVSLGFNGKLKKKNMWYYIYDEDIEPARIYSPSIKSIDNCPREKSSIQAEIYRKNSLNEKSRFEINLDELVNKLENARMINKKDICISDVRFEKYANVIFDKEIYINREKIISKLHEMGIYVIGRFGCWEYYWSDQSFQSGYNVKLN